MDSIELEQLLLADHRSREQLLTELRDAFNAKREFERARSRVCDRFVVRAQFVEEEREHVGALGNHLVE